MKKLLILLGILLIPNFTSSAELENIQLEMRDYDTIEIPAGTFIPVMNTQEISTQYCSEGYKVKFIVTTDLYMYDTNIVPKDTEIYGYIEQLHDPVIGTNASMKIRVSKMVYTNGIEVPIRGYLYNANNNMFGGSMSEPVKYRKMAQRQQNVRYTTLQVKPVYERKMGKHTTIETGSNEIVVLISPAQIINTP